MSESVIEKPQVESKPLIIYGKKIILFPFTRVDLEDFCRIHREDEKGYLGQYCLKLMTEEESLKYVALLLQTNQIHIWIVMTKEGKGSRRAGYIYLTNLSKFSTTISGVMDNDFAKGLTREMRKGTYTFAEDAVQTLKRFCFEKLNLMRVESDVFSHNRRAYALMSRCGFKKEGLLRKAFEVDGEYKDIIILSILKEEFDAEQKPER